LQDSFLTEFLQKGKAERGGDVTRPISSRASTMPRTKVVVRNLPPDLSEQVFVEAVSSAGFAVGARVGWADYTQGKAKTKLTTPSVAHLNFADEAALFDFSARFGGGVFADQSGREYRATVEYAPYQKVPRGKPRRDRREGTIEKDPEYQVQFVDPSGCDCSARGFAPAANCLELIPACSS